MTWRGEFDGPLCGRPAGRYARETMSLSKRPLSREGREADAAMEDGDTLDFRELRADRARRSTRAFVNADFDGFARKESG
ncbi:hypothetical protein KCP78_18520 [Salmonella enterica subsp. enterica]|nr:hypothetical protein KCP78_18520 [Salmonella enterica subsp. enterica]